MLIIWEGLKKWYRTPTGQLILLVLFFFCWYQIQKDYHQSLLATGNEIIYHGNTYKIGEISENLDTHKTTLQFMYSTRNISADSVTIAHQAFWQNWL